MGGEVVGNYIFIIIANIIIPVFVRLNVDKINLAQSNSSNQIRVCHSIPRETFNASDLEIFKIQNNIHLSKVKLNHSLLLCDDITCNTSHKQIAGWNKVYMYRTPLYCTLSFPTLGKL